ncbi:MAG: PQQ-binding-like beta-propeller repeat protein [Ruminococcus sp.]|nr:PQQ-binding-like beta-propeller repeat protein [Ruminococcus sp.]
MKRTLKSLCAACAAVVMAASLGVSATAWEQFRGNEDNNGVIDAKTPTDPYDAVLLWATMIGTEKFTDPPTPITLDGDNIFCTSADNVYKIDKTTGEVVSTGKMAGTSTYASTPPTVADGMIFVGLDNGTVQAFDEDTLQSLWVYTNDKGGYSYSNITYSDGCIYTGFYIGVQTDADFVCIDVTDEDPASTDEVKAAKWEYTSPGGFYWAGAIAEEGFIAVGTEDGAGALSWTDPDYVEDTGSVVTLNSETGEVLNKQSGIVGDIRSAIVYDEASERYYFTTRGGYFCSVAISGDGVISDLKQIDLNSGDDWTVACTSSPVIADGRAYFGCNGKGWNDYNGSFIAVVDLESFTLAYTAETKAAVQTSGLLSQQDGFNYVYFQENAWDGQVRYIVDKPGVTELIEYRDETDADGNTHHCAPVLFAPKDELQQYAICSIIADEDGTLYFKNDSAHIMAVGARLTGLSVEMNDVYPEGYELTPSDYTVTAYYANGAERDVTQDATVSLSALQLGDDTVSFTYGEGLYDGNGDPVSDITLDVNITVLTAEEYEEYINGSESSEESSEESIADSFPESSEADSSESSSSSSSSKSESSSKAAAASTTNPATGAAAGGLLAASAALAAAIVIKRRK